MGGEEGLGDVGEGGWRLIRKPSSENWKRVHNLAGGNLSNVCLPAKKLRGSLGAASPCVGSVQHHFKAWNRPAALRPSGPQPAYP